MLVTAKVRASLRRVNVDQRLAATGSPPPCGEGLGVGVSIMPTAIPKNAIARARRLRHDMTEGERKLWVELRQFRRWYGIHVRRQVPIGDYVADFAIHSHKLIIEVDGEHHFFTRRQQRDQARDQWLADEGYRVMRLNTGELNDQFDGCIAQILAALGLTRTETPEAVQ